MAWKTPPLAATLGDVEITVEEIQDTLARAVARHSYPGKDTSDLEDTGAEPREVTLTGLIYGEAWLEHLAALEAALADSEPHVLVHPQIGTLQGRVTRLEVTHRSVEHNVARLRLAFTEGTVQQWSFAASANLSSAAAAVQVAASAARTAFAGVA